MLSTITEEDRALIKPYVILPLVQAAFERDSRVFLMFKTPDPYVEWLLAARERLSVEAQTVRYQTRNRGIKIYEQQRVKNGILAKYLCRGSSEEMTFLNAEVASEAAELMRRYLSFDNVDS